MTTVTYTTSRSVESSAMGDVFYNDHTQELVLDMNGVLYRYNGVPEVIFRELLEADSKGIYYRDVIRTFGPADRLGDYMDADFEEIVPEPVRAEAGTPKGLDYASTTVNTNVISLAAPVGNEIRKHVVTFEVEGKKKKHTLGAGSVDEAVDTVKEIADMLDLKFKIRKVTVHFE